MLLLRKRFSTPLPVVGVMGLVAIIASPSTRSAATGTAPDRPLRVVTKAIALFVLPNTSPPPGFSIDLWNEVARRMQVKFEWKLVTTMPEPLEAVPSGNTDVAMAAITITPERENSLEFFAPVD